MSKSTTRRWLIGPPGWLFVRYCAQNRARGSTSNVHGHTLNTRRKTKRGSIRSAAAPTRLQHASASNRLAADRLAPDPGYVGGLVSTASSTRDALSLYRRATNYIAAAMIYLQDNSLLEEPLKPEHIKHRLLGHWGTVPGINLVYAGLNRLILDTQASILLVTGPGHGAPANLANLWLEGAMEDINPRYSRDRSGIEALIRDFSWPGGYPSHLAPMVPGVIHEGGERGYA